MLVSLSFLLSYIPLLLAAEKMIWMTRNLKGVEYKMVKQRKNKWKEEKYNYWFLCQFNVLHTFSILVRPIKVYWLRINTVLLYLNVLGNCNMMMN